MKLIFEHLIVNGYVIDVFGEVDFYQVTENSSIIYFVNTKRLRITKDGFPFHERYFMMDYRNSNLFHQTLVDTEKQYQDYLREIYNGNEDKFSL